MVNRFKKWLIHKLGGVEKLELVKYDINHCSTQEICCSYIMPFSEFTVEELGKLAHIVSSNRDIGNEQADVTADLDILISEDENSMLTYFLKSANENLCYQFASYFQENNILYKTLEWTSHGVKITYKLNYVRKDDNV